MMMSQHNSGARPDEQEDSLPTELSGESLEVFIEFVSVFCFGIFAVRHLGS